MTKLYPLTGELFLLSLPDELAKKNVRFWTDTDHVEAFAANPTLSISEYAQAIPINPRARSIVERILLANHFCTRQIEMANEYFVSECWEEYHEYWNDQLADRRFRRRRFRLRWRCRIFRMFYGRLRD